MEIKGARTFEYKCSQEFMFDVVFFILVLRFFYSIALVELEVTDCLTSI